MKTLTHMLVTACILTSLSAFAQGGDKVGGGGDASEMRVNEIRADILSWIEKDGAKRIKFPSGITLEDYKREMKKILAPQAVVLGFVENDNSHDPELKVQVENVPKTCRGFISDKDKKPHVICNISRFENTPEDRQYRLIHHEYAGLVRMERNDGAASDYEISNQVIGYLRPTTTLRLYAGKLGACGLEGTVNDRIKDCAHSSGNFSLVSRFPDGREIYQDMKSGLIWGDLYGRKMLFQDAQQACNYYLAETDTTLQLKWKLHSKKEFENAVKNSDIGNNLPRMDGGLWTSTKKKTFFYHWYAWSYAKDLFLKIDLVWNQEWQVRCVATEKKNSWDM